MRWAVLAPFYGQVNWGTEPWNNSARKHWSWDLNSGSPAAHPQPQSQSCMLLGLQKRAAIWVQVAKGDGRWGMCWVCTPSGKHSALRPEAYLYWRRPWLEASVPEELCAGDKKERSKRPKYRQPQWRAAQLTSCWSWTGAWVCGGKWSGLTARSGRAAGQCVGERWHKESFGKNSNILLAIWNSYLTHSQPKDCDWNSSQLSSVGFEFCQH